MNPDNYGTPKACRDLLNAGIFIETDFYWPIDGEEKLFSKYQMDRFYNPAYFMPAPSLAEMWRELPETIKTGPSTWKHLTTEKMGPRMEAYYRPCELKDLKSSENPTDALIYLRIWIEKMEGTGE